MSRYFVGVDGGATSCRVRVEDEHGNVLGSSMSGPANISVSVSEAWNSIYHGLTEVLTPLNLSIEDSSDHYYAGMGLAGCEIKHAYEEFLGCHHPFQALQVISDAHAACLGAHHGKSGSIIIVGTGTVGFSLVNHKSKQVGGWGFPHDDKGGGAWLGLEAVKLCLESMDGRKPISKFTSCLRAEIGRDDKSFVVWVNAAKSRDFAKLAPLVIDLAQEGDDQAIALLTEASHAVAEIYHALIDEQSCELPLCLMGGIAPYISSYLPSQMKQRLHVCQSPAEAGAIFQVRQSLKHSEAVV